MVEIMVDAGLHALAGVVIAGIDYSVTRLTTSKEDRVQRKYDTIKSMELILDAHGDGLEARLDGETGEEIEIVESIITPNSLQYARNIHDVRAYLEQEGTLKEHNPALRRAVNWFKTIGTKEKINTLSKPGLALFGIGTEIIYDSLGGWEYYSNVLGESPLAALSANAYQIPAFITGLFVGRGLVKPVDYVLRSGDERRADKAIDELTRETPIMDYVLTYQMPERVAEELAAKGMASPRYKMTKAGRKAFKTLTGIGEKLEDTFDEHTRGRKRKRAASDEKTRSRFDELTRGR